MGPRAQTDRKLVFHFEAIDHLLRTNADHEEAWRRYFTENDIQPFHVIYEDLTTSYERTAWRSCNTCTSTSRSASSSRRGA